MWAVFAPVGLPPWSITCNFISISKQSVPKSFAFSTSIALLSSIASSSSESLASSRKLEDTTGAMLLPSLSLARLLYIMSSACLPTSASIANESTALPSSALDVARRSPLVSAPSCDRRLATADANLCSPPMPETSRQYWGAEDWFDRWERPSCWTALSADHGNSRVMCRRRRWLTARLSACNETPVLAASDMMA